MAEIFNITDLPLIPLEHIFTFLTPSDRRICSLVSKQFHDVWMAKKFSSDRWLCFDGCVIEKNTPPMSVLMKSERAYQNLYFDNIKLIDNELWDKLGETVTCVKIGFDARYNSETFISFFPSLLCKFKVLKKIDINLLTLQTFNFANQNIDMLFTNIEEIILHHVKDDWVHHNILKFMPKLKNLEMHRVFVNNSTLDLIKKYEKILTYLEIDFGLSSDGHIPENPPKKISDNQILQVSGKSIKILKIRIGFRKIDLFVEKLNENFPQLEALHIETEYTFPTYQLEKLKSIRIYSYREHETIDQLKIFPNLKHLELHYGQDPSNCFIGHKHFQMETLEILKIATYFDNHLPCSQCFNTVIRSFPNLTCFESGDYIQTENLENMKKSMPKLRFLSFSPRITISKIINFELSLSSSFSNLNTLEVENPFELGNVRNCPVLPFLRKLSLRIKNENLNNNDICELIEKMPSLENLKLIDCSHQKPYDLSKFFDTVAKHCKRLLNFESWLNGYDKNTSLEIIQTLAINCEFIKTIRLYTKLHEFKTSTFEEEYLAKIFKDRTSLRQIHVFGQALITSILLNKSIEKEQK
uniref:CSON011518 protein n=1 Tax=Culicoides sonorensis TaxID=179676 RepID=A0A336MFH6_CULSO